MSMCVYGAQCTGAPFKVHFYLVSSYCGIFTFMLIRMKHLMKVSERVITIWTHSTCNNVKLWTQIESNTKVLEWQGQFFCLCYTLKTFWFRVKAKYRVIRISVASFTCLLSGFFLLQFLLQEVKCRLIIKVNHPSFFLYSS